MRIGWLLLVMSVVVVIGAWTQDAPDVAALKAKAAAGDARAQEALGRAYKDGVGVAQDDNAAVQWFRAAADQGDAAAENDLALMYRWGRGVGKNMAEAVRWYRKSARQGHGPAMFNLAAAYYNGDGVRVNEISAYAWFALAARTGNQPAREAVERTKAELSSQGFTEAQLTLAYMLEKGEAGAKDPAEAKDIVSRTCEAAVPKTPLAMFCLGYRAEHRLLGSTDARKAARITTGRRRSTTIPWRC